MRIWDVLGKHAARLKRFGEAGQDARFGLILLWFFWGIALCMLLEGVVDVGSACRKKDREKGGIDQMWWKR